MDRAIKFRAWDTKRKQFVSQGEIIFSNYGDTNIKVYPNSQDYIGDICHDYYEPSRFIIMQFTGLLDCEGKEIWEGDIVELTDGNIYRGVVKFGSYKHVNQGGYDWVNVHGFYIENNGKCIFEDNGWTNLIKVIGNLFEHPNLLNNES